MVSVPVLSVQSTSMAPRFWIEFSRLTMTFFFDIASAPLDRQTETIIGSISGVNPTATAIEREKKASAPTMLGETVDQENDRHHHHHKMDHQQVNFYALVKLVFTCGPE